MQEPVLLFLGVVVGICGGGASILFHWLIEHAQLIALGGYGPALERLPSLPWYWVLAVPAMGGLLVGPIVYGWAAEARGHGVPEVMEAIQVRGGVMRPRVAIAKSVASAITIGSGGSVGQEGPVVQIGAVIGSVLGQSLRLPVDHRRTLVGCGAAAGIAATFNAPIAGAFFALEVILGNFAIATFSPIVLACVVATVVSRAYFGNVSGFHLPEYTMVTWWELFPYAALGAVCGLLAIIFIRFLYVAEDYAAETPVPPKLRPAVGGLIVGCMLLLSPHLYGSGFASIDALLHGDVVWQMAAALIALKLLACSVTLASGGSGGVFSPSLFLGATTGYSVGYAVNLFSPYGSGPPEAYALVGMGALLSGATHAPLASLLILFELTNDYGIILPLMLAITVATVTARALMTDSIYTRKLRRKGVPLLRGLDDLVMTSFRVSDVMRPTLPTVAADASFQIVLERFLAAPIDELYVLTEDGRLCGTIYLHDIKGALGERGLGQLVTASDLMNGTVPTARPIDTLAECLQRFAATGRESLPVVDTTQPVGLITRKDLIEVYDREVLRRELLGTTTAADRAKAGALPMGFRLETVGIPVSWVGQTLRDLQIRQRTGATVIGIQLAGRDGAEAAGPDRPLRLGDSLIVLGNLESMAALEALVRHAAVDAGN
jgi:CIC family chloride channel protein